MARIRGVITGPQSALDALEDAILHGRDPSNLGPALRTAAIRQANLEDVYPGRAEGGTGKTGLGPRDKEGYVRLLKERLAGQQLRDVLKIPRFQR